MIMQIMTSDISGYYKILSPVSMHAWLQFLKPFLHLCPGAETPEEKEEVIILMLDP